MYVTHSGANQNYMLGEADSSKSVNRNYIERLTLKQIILRENWKKCGGHVVLPSVWPTVWPTG